ncbi:hypothetical protein HEP84_35800 [Streptomyces sp. RLB1-33]|nr:hypothetical protein [Streptomyces sp. RLB1-33]QIY67935.1 hypothetical protein HEP84_35800 [Streptomyces sp. RLB1-33]
MPDDRRGLTALFWSNVNPYGTFRLDMDKRLDLAPAAAVPRPRTPEEPPARLTTEITDTHDFQDLTDPRINEASWQAHDLLRAYAARDRAAIVEHLAHLEDDQLEFAKGVVANFNNDTRGVLRDTGRPHTPATLVREVDAVARFASAEHEFTVTTAARRLARGEAKMQEVIGAMDVRDRIHTLAVYTLWPSCSPCSAASGCRTCSTRPHGRPRRSADGRDRTASRDAVRTSRPSRNVRFRPAVRWSVRTSTPARPGSGSVAPAPFRQRDERQSWSYASASTPVSAWVMSSRRPSCRGPRACSGAARSSP